MPYDIGHDSDTIIQQLKSMQEENREPLVVVSISVANE